MKLHSRKPNEFNITQNKTVMEYAIEYSKSNMNKIECLKLINHVRLYERVFLPCELLRDSGKEQTEAFRCNFKKSQIKWTFYHYSIDQLSKRAFKL